jgi:hypothetical protein
MNVHLKTIRNCCDAGDKDKPDLKKFINQLKDKNKESAFRIKLFYPKYFKPGDELSDPSKREDAIYDIEFDLEKFNLIMEDIEKKILAELEYKATKYKKHFYDELKKEEIRTEEVRVAKAERMEREKERQKNIDLVKNTKLYKELTTAFEKNFMPGSAQGSMNLLKLKMMGKSDGEVARFFEDGFNIYKNCLVDELPKRFTKTKLKQMENEWGTSDLEVGSITMKCEPIVVRELEKYLLGQ